MSFIQDEYKNGIYLLTDEDKEMIKEHLKFYEDLFKYGNSILDNGFQVNMPDYELTIYSMVYRIIELLDTIKVMTENSLINSALIITRSLLEISVQLYYVVFDESNIQKKACIFQMLDIKRTAPNQNEYYNRMQQYECYKNYIDVIKKNQYPNWYSYCENKKTTLRKLFMIVNWKDIYKRIYNPLCLEVHEIDHMGTNIVYFNNKFNFKPFRIFENHVLLLNTILTVLQPLFDKIIPLYCDEEINQEWSNYSKKLSEYIKFNNDVSNIEKTFNPTSKWF